MSAAAAATSAGSGSTRSTSARGSTTSTSPEPNTTSSGTSRNTGPRCALAASAAAAATSVYAPSTEVTVAARFVIDASTGRWSNSWSAPRPHPSCAARPPMTTSGEPLNHAVVTALTPLVTPGPAVRAASAGRRVSFASPSAANVAVCS